MNTMGSTEIISFYQDAYEDGRMEREPLEFIRCKEIISRYLSEEPMEIADIGGATGVFSFWLAAKGHNVHLLDFTPSHIQKAKEYGQSKNISLASYDCCDARALPYGDACFDLVLEMGPLYHLQGRGDRLSCLSEARRILRPGGMLLCEAISRYAPLIDGFKQLLVDDEKFIGILDKDIETGLHSPGDTSYFTTSYLHTPEDIKGELADSGFGSVEIIAAEGFANALNSQQLLGDGRISALLLDYKKNRIRSRTAWGIQPSHCRDAQRAAMTAARRKGKDRGYAVPSGQKG